LAFQEFNFEDKVYLKGEGNVTNVATRGTKGGQNEALIR